MTGVDVAKVRSVLASAARLPVPWDGVADGDDLYALGMSSWGAVQAMLGLEAAFGVEFPERLLGHATFVSVDAVVAALTDCVPKGGPSVDAS